MSSASSQSSNIVLQTDEVNGIATLTINRPSSHNALTRSMMVELAGHFRSFADSDNLRAVILTGSGNSFCSGVDLKVAESVFKGDVGNPLEDPVVQMELCPVPIIGAVSGHAVTAGFELALACDILLADSTAKFMDTHARFGIFPSWGLSQKLPRLIGANRARAISLASTPISASTAKEWGLVSAVVAPELLMSTAFDIALKIAKNDKELVFKYKAVINDGLQLTLESGRALERSRAHKFYSEMKPESFQAMKKFVLSRRDVVQTKSRL